MNRLKSTLPHPPLVFMFAFAFYFILLLMSGAILSAQVLVFQREVDTIPVIISGVPVPRPFTGGINNSKPAFTDIDNDGDFDLLVGDGGGNLKFYRNNSNATNLMFTLEPDSLASIDVGFNSAPTFDDIDKDGDFDLLVGEFDGNLNFYRNDGTATNPMFPLEPDSLVSIDVGFNSAPTFADIDNDGDPDLFVGEEDGNLNFYRNDGTATDPKFILVTENFDSIDVGDFSIPSFVKIDNDDDFDLLVGEPSGNLNFYRNDGTATNPVFTLVTENFDTINNVGNNSAPSFADIDKDGDFDLLVGKGDGNLNFYRNTGTAANPVFTLVTENFDTINVGDNSAPTFVDIDNDGDFDLLVGEVNGNLNFYRNTGTAANPMFVLDPENFASSIDVGDFSTPTFVNIDNDGDFDLFVGEVDGNLNFYRNHGTATNPVFTLVTENFASIDVGDNSAPIFADIDNDGDFDLLVGERDGNLSFYCNDGNATNHAFNFPTENFASIDVGDNSAPSFADIDKDGDFDLFVGDFNGGLNFYRNVTNRVPVAANPIPNQTLIVGGASFTRDLNASPAIFSDPDGNMLAYSTSSSAMNIATASISGTILTIAPVTVGSAIITVNANDGKGGTASTMFTVTVLPSYPSSLNLNTTVTYPSRPTASDYPATDYRLVGLPGTSNRLVNEFLSGAQNKDWQVFRDNGAASNFFVAFDGSANFQFSVGRAFWIISKSSFSVNITASSVLLNAMQEIEIPLQMQNGWNLITNPFTASVLWSKIQTANNVTEPIWAFNGSFAQADTFKAYAGYYFFNATNLPLLKIPYSAYFSGNAADVASTKWRVHISLIAGKFNEQAVSFGVANEASHGLDVLDFRKPRAIATMPAVSFIRPEWDANYNTFATDIRPEFEDSESWEFDVRTTKREASQLAFSGIGKISGEFEVYLIDVGRAHTVNLREDSLYRFMPAAELSKFSVVVGKKEAVQEKLNSVALPKEFALGPNYPNPFSANGTFGNPTTTIPIAVPAAAEIKLKLYNLLGAEVKTLYDGTIEAGRYWFNWDGRNELGNQVATGVYLYRLTTRNGVSLLGKMILIR